MAIIRPVEGADHKAYTTQYKQYKQMMKVKTKLRRQSLVTLCKSEKSSFSQVKSGEVG